MTDELLKNRVAIVTGASRGLGEGIARALAHQGCAVALFSRDLGRLREHERALTEAGRAAVAISVDVADTTQVERAVRDVVDRFERVDILVNNAAIAPSIPFLDVTDEVLDSVIDVNIKGVWHCTRAVLPGMVARGYGRIINISSVTGPMVSGKGVTAYAASKGALSAFTRSLALEVAEHGINVNAICPGSFDTPMMRGLAESRGRDAEEYIAELGKSVPLSRLGTLEEMGELAVFLASEGSSYITGTEIVIDGGNVIQEHK